VTYLVVLLLLRVFEHRLIFFPDYPGRLSGDWQPHGLPVEDVWLQTADSVKLHAWWIPNVSAEFTMVAFHGNAANIATRAEVYRFLHRFPVNVLAVEYRGYGRSEGAPSEAGFYLDAQAAYDYLTRQRGMAPRGIIPYGQSLGTAVAVDLAAKREVGGIVLEAPFPSTREVARRVYWFLPGVEFMARSKFDTASKLANIHAPILIVHCAHDPVLDFPLGEKVYAGAHEPKFLWRVEGKCHEEASLVRPKEYRAQLLEFLDRIKVQNGTFF
jgi:fermentation-respiration switch protein FrsA (DUF1100 family)